MRTVALAMTVAFLAGFSGPVTSSVQAADCGCNSAPNCCHCRHLCRRCTTCQTCASDEGRSKITRRDESRSVVTPTTVLPYMPVYAMPVMAYAARASYEPIEGRSLDCRSSEARGTTADRITQIEDDLRDVRRSIRDLQVLVEGQMDILRKLQPPAKP